MASLWTDKLENLTGDCFCGLETRHILVLANLSVAGISGMVYCLVNLFNLMVTSFSRKSY